MNTSNKNKLYLKNPKSKQEKNVKKTKVNLISINNNDNTIFIKTKRNKLTTSYIETSKLIQQNPKITTTVNKGYNITSVEDNKTHSKYRSDILTSHISSTTVPNTYRESSTHRKPLNSYRNNKTRLKSVNDSSVPKNKKTLFNISKKHLDSSHISRQNNNKTFIYNKFNIKKKSGNHSHEKDLYHKINKLILNLDTYIIKEEPNENDKKSRKLINNKTVSDFNNQNKTKNNILKNKVLSRQCNNNKTYTNYDKILISKSNDISHTKLGKYNTKSNSRDIYKRRKTINTINLNENNKLKKSNILKTNSVLIDNKRDINMHLKSRTGNYKININTNNIINKTHKVLNHNNKNNIKYNILKLNNKPQITIENKKTLNYIHNNISNKKRYISLNKNNNKKAKSKDKCTFNSTKNLDNIYNTLQSKKYPNISLNFSHNSNKNNIIEDDLEKILNHYEEWNKENKLFKFDKFDNINSIIKKINFNDTHINDDVFSDSSNYYTNFIKKYDKLKYSLDLSNKCIYTTISTVNTNSGSTKASYKRNYFS